MVYARQGFVLPGETCSNLCLSRMTCHHSPMEGRLGLQAASFITMARFGQALQPSPGRDLLGEHQLSILFEHLLPARIGKWIIS